MEHEPDFIFKTIARLANLNSQNQFDITKQKGFAY